MTDPRLRWTPPPNWPSPPDGWAPPKGWGPEASWGPAPPGWQFWQPREGPLHGTRSPEPVDSPSLDVPAPELGHKFKKSDLLLDSLHPMLVTGESVVALFSINSVRPLLDVLVITNSRVIAGLRTDLPNRRKVEVSAGQIASFEIHDGFTGNRLEVCTDNGDLLGLGTLSHKEDTAAVRRHLGVLQVANAEDVGLDERIIEGADPPLPVDQDAPVADEVAPTRKEPSRRPTDADESPRDNKARRMTFTERMDQLERIASLQASGALTEGEARRLKSELLDTP